MTADKFMEWACGVVLTGARGAVAGREPGAVAPSNAMFQAKGRDLEEIIPEFVEPA